MRDRETIDSELRRIALRRRSVGEGGGQPLPREADDLLDELLAHSAGTPPATAVKTGGTNVVADTRTRTIPRKPRGVPRHLKVLAVLPLSLVALVAVVVMLAVHRQNSPAQPAAETPPSATPPESVGPPGPAAPKAPAPRVDVADMTFVAALKHEGVPLPSDEYATAHGHAVCDFLAHQSNFADAADFVQRSSLWDADQSAKVTAGAIVSYCPPAQPSSADQLTPVYQNTLSDLQAIERKLQDMQGTLHDIQGNLAGIPGQ